MNLQNAKGSEAMKNYSVSVWADYGNGDKEIACARIRRVTASLPPSPTNTLFARRIRPTLIESQRFNSAAAAAITNVISSFIFGPL